MEDLINQGVCLVIEDDQGRILLTQRGRKTSDERGKWENCGGKIDPGESLEEAAIREAKEEIGCEVELLGIIEQIKLVTASGAKWHATIFKAKIKSGTPKVLDPDEVSGIRWFEKSELAKADLASYTRADFQRFGWI